MMNKMQKGGVSLMIFVLGVMTVVVFNHVFATDSQPGTISDPLVSKSYIESYMDAQQAEMLTEVTDMIAGLEVTASDSQEPVYMEDLYNYVDLKFESYDLEGLLEQGGSEATDEVDNTASFVVILLNGGEQLICEESAEIILRSGRAMGIANSAGDGLSDVTMGADVGNDELIIKNHLLIVPRTDGRGIEALEMSYVMVKGNYIIQ
jgi:hypothetical protein